MKIWNGLLRFVSLWLLLTGCFLAIRDGLLIDWWDARELTALCLMASVAVTALYTGRRSALCGGALMILAVYQSFFRNGTDVLIEWARLVRQATLRINQYHYMHLPVGGEITEAYGSGSFLLLAALLLGLVVGLGLAFRKVRPLAFVPIFVSYLGGMCVGYAPKLPAILCLIVGMGLALAVPGKRTSPAEWKTSLLALGSLSLAMCLTAAFYENAAAAILRDSRHYQQRQLELEDRLIAWADGVEIFNQLRWQMGGEIKEAQLTSQPPGQGSEIIFEMTVETLPEAPLYVKDFCSIQYENGRWLAEDGDTLRGYADARQISMEELSRQELSRSWEQLKRTGLEPQTISMDIKKRTGNTALWPYFCEMPQGAEMVGDAGVRIEGRKYQVQGYALGTEAFYSAAAWVMEPLPIQEEYRKYLREYCGRQSSQAHIALGEDMWATAEALHQCVYSFDLEPVPEGADPVVDFVFRQKKGYCMHFASAYALLNQSITNSIVVSMSQPFPMVRYASGYLVMPGDFRENADGTFTAAVPQYRGHAWAESYVPQLGWYPVEVTPPSYIESLMRAGSGVTPSQALAEPEEGQPDVDTPQQPKPKKPTQPEAQQPDPDPASPQADNTQNADDQAGASGSGGAQPSGALPLGMIARCAGALLLLACMAALFWLRVCRVRRKWAARFDAPGNNQAVLSLFDAMLNLLKIHQIRPRWQEEEDAFAARVEERFPWMAAGAFAQAAETAQAARYGQNQVSQEARAAVRELHQELMMQTAQQLSRGRRLWHRYVKVRLM